MASQKEGMAVFAKIDPSAPLIVAESVWQYSHHLLPGLLSHRGPILTVANWSGTWPGLVGIAEDLNGSLAKSRREIFHALEQKTSTTNSFDLALASWLRTGVVRHKANHVKPFARAAVPHRGAKVTAAKIAVDLRHRKSIMGVFDEGCMGMYNAVIPDELLFPLGVYKERLSQSALYYGATQVSDREARGCLLVVSEKGPEVSSRLR